MKKLLATLTLGLLLTACTATDLMNDLLNAKQEATEAVENLTNEAIGIKEGVGAKIEQIQQAADSVSDAVDAINQAKEDVGTVMGTEE